MKKKFIRQQIKFVRYGNLSPVIHENYIKNIPQQSTAGNLTGELGFHSPPCRKGLYAFVYPYIEKFLISSNKYSGLESPHPKVTYIKDQKGRKIEFNFHRAFTKSSNMISDLNLDSLKHPDQVDYLKKFLNNENRFKKDHSLMVKGESYFLVKQIKPKIFNYEGEIWHHLEDFLPHHGCVLERKGYWVKTHFCDYKLALTKALGRANHSTYRPFKDSWDQLEVFIERV